MNRYYQFFKQINSYDLLLKSHYTNSFQLPSISAIHLNISSVQLALHKKQIVAFLLILELVSHQKSCLTFSKKTKIQLKIKKGMVIGCKVILKKHLTYEFIDTLNTFILPSIKDFHGFKLHERVPHIFSFSIPNLLNFPELENEFLSFSTLPPLHITINLTIREKTESNLFFSALNFPIT